MKLAVGPTTCSSSSHQRIGEQGTSDRGGRGEVMSGDTGGDELRQGLPVDWWHKSMSCRRDRRWHCSTGELI